MGNSNPKETCPSERSSSASLHFTNVNTRSNYQFSWETCASVMANDASLNVIAPYEKEEIEHSDVINVIAPYEKEEIKHSDVIETCPSEMDYNASQKCIGPSELEEMDLSDLKEYIRSNIEIIRSLNNKNIVPKERKTIDLDNMNHIWTMIIEEYRIFKMWKTRKESDIADELGEKQVRERIKFTIYMLLLTILLGNNNNCKFLATPDRLKISCITVYLLGNDGAHSYNGNGKLLSTRRKYTRFTDEELLDEIRPANLPLDVLQRQPTDKEIARLSGKIGHKYRRLAYELGLTRVQLDHLTEDCRVTEHRIESMLFKWRDGIGENKNENNPTFEVLVNALDVVGINSDIVCQSLDRA